MSTKPVTLPRWATDLSNNTAPSSGQQDTGWTVGQTGISSYDNWKAYWTYKWIEWLNDGDVSFNDVSARDVTGRRLSANQFIYSSGHVQAMTADISELALSPYASYIQLTPDTDGWILHGISGGLSGFELNLINNSTTNSFIIENNSATCPTSTSRIYLPPRWTTVDSKIAISPQGSIRLRYSGVLNMWHVVGYSNIAVPQLLWISPASAQPAPSGAPTFAANVNGWTIGTTTGRLAYPVDLSYGDVITDWQIIIRKISGSGTVTGQLYKYNASTVTETPVGSAGTYPGSSGYTVLSPPGGISEIVTNSQEFYYLVLTGGGTTGDASYHATISYRRNV